MRIEDDMAPKEVKKKGKYQYLAGNIALFSVSNFVSKILVFLLVPLYTDVLTTTEYGIADMMQVTLLLLVPALTMNIGEAALRFGIENTEKRGSILRIGVTYVLRADAIVVGLCIAAFSVVDQQYRLYILLFALLFAANSMFEFLILYFQGCEAVPIVVIGSVCSTAVTVISNIVFLLVIRIGLNGYIYSQILAYVFASVLMFTIARSAGIIKDVRVDEDLRGQMLLYGTPLIAYSTGSWINNAADRYLVAYMCGVAVNGVYGVAYKIPAILMVFQRIFAQAWQMSATKSYKDDKSEEFFTRMYRTYNCFMVIGCAVLILLVNPIATFLFRKEFYEAWIYVPPLLISVIFGALTGFLGSICLAHKDSRSMGIATSVGAVLNIAGNLLLIPRFGAMGAAVATAASYALMCTLAYVFVRKYVVIDNNILVDILSYLILIASSVAMIGRLNGRYVINAVLLAVLVLLYHNDVTVMIRKISELIKSRLHGNIKG